jgi:tetratricopeptide (TPR) repeat protein
MPPIKAMPSTQTGEAMPSTPSVEAMRSAQAGPSAIHIMENHDAALAHWRAAGRDRILVHVDPHHDAWFTGDNVPVNAANFVGYALRERLIREWYWVVPDSSFASAQNRGLLLAAMRKLIGSYPGRGAPIQEVRFAKSGEPRNNAFRTSLLGVPLTVCTLDAIPTVAENVLLDLDVDFMTTPRVNYSRGNDAHPALPWCWPDEILDRIAKKNLRWDVATIALSVEGGFTPLAWKYLGDELSLRIEANPDAAARLHGYELMRQAAAAGSEGRSQEEALKLCCEATLQLPESAAPLWHRAQFLLDQSLDVTLEEARAPGRAAEARELRAQAIALDPSYRTPYHTEGLWHYAAGRTLVAKHAFLRTLALDPQDAVSLVGLARLAMRRKQWAEAEKLLRRAIESDANLLDAHRALGKTLAQQRRYREAAAAYEVSLRLALAGHSSLFGSSVISTEPARWADRRHWRTLWNLAEARERAGDYEQAQAAYRMAAAGGQDGVRMRARLARVALRRGYWNEAAREILAAAARIPGAIKDALRAAWLLIERAWHRAVDARRAR